MAIDGSANAIAPSASALRCPVCFMSSPPECGFALTRHPHHTGRELHADYANHLNHCGGSRGGLVEKKGRRGAPLWWWCLLRLRHDAQIGLGRLPAVRIFLLRFL